MITDHKRNWCFARGTRHTEWTGNSKNLQFCVRLSVRQAKVECRWTLITHSDDSQMVIRLCLFWGWNLKSRWPFGRASCWISTGDLKEKVFIAGMQHNWLKAIFLFWFSLTFPQAQMLMLQSCKDRQTHTQIKHHEIFQVLVETVICYLGQTFKQNLTSCLSHFHRRHFFYH